MKKEKIELPRFLAKNTFYWESGTTSARRSFNEKLVLQEAISFFEAIGFKLKLVFIDVKSIKGERQFDNQKIEIVFSYYESAQNVYKTFKIYRDGKKTNIRIIKKMIEEVNLGMVNTIATSP